MFCLLQITKMSGPNSNLSQPPMYSSNQNAYSPITGSVNQPPGIPNSMSGSSFPPQSSLGNSIMPPASVPQTFSQPGVAPPIAQNYSYPLSPQVPFMDSTQKPPPVSFNNHSPIPSASPKNPASSYTEKQSFVQNGPINNSPFTSSSSGPNLNNNSSQVNGHGISNALYPPQSMPQPNQWTSPSRLPPPPGHQNQKLSTSSMGGASPMPHQYPGVSSQSAVSESKLVPKMSQVPSSGISC